MKLKVGNRLQIARNDRQLNQVEKLQIQLIAKDQEIESLKREIESLKEMVMLLKK